MFRIAFVLGCLVAAASPAQAGPYGEALGSCAIEATTPADRTTLLRWSFLTAAANPALADLISVTPALRERSARAVATVFNRILLQDCRRQTREALRREGEEGVQSGFQALGLMAGREMLMNDAAAAALEEMVTFLDQQGLATLIEEAGAQPPT